jgi:hypothetical protein
MPEYDERQWREMQVLRDVITMLVERYVDTEEMVDLLVYMSDEIRRRGEMMLSQERGDMKEVCDGSTK